MPKTTVIPAHAGIHACQFSLFSWIPAFAGMTNYWAEWGVSA
jgi:hypothetical protein